MPRACLDQPHAAGADGSDINAVARCARARAARMQMRCSSRSAAGRRADACSPPPTTMASSRCAGSRLFAVSVRVCSCLGVTLSPAAFSVPCRRQLPKISRECRPQRLCNVRQRCIAHAHALPVPIIGVACSCCVLAHSHPQERSFLCSRQVRARTPIVSRSSSNSLGRYVVSVGGDDRSMFQWRVVKDFANSDAF